MFETVITQLLSSSHVMAEYVDRHVVYMFECMCAEVQAARVRGAVPGNIAGDVPVGQAARLGCHSYKACSYHCCFCCCVVLDSLFETQQQHTIQQLLSHAVIYYIVAQYNGHICLLVWSCFNLFFVWCCS